MAQGLCMGDGGSIITVMNHRMIEFFSIAGVTAPISLQVLAWTIGKRSRMSEGESKAFGTNGPRAWRCLSQASSPSNSMIVYLTFIASPPAKGASSPSSRT